MKFTDRLKKLRKDAGLTQKELAKRSGVSYSYLTKLEGGYQDNPTREILEAIGGVLKVPLSAIYDFNDFIDDESTEKQAAERWDALETDAQKQEQALNLFEGLSEANKEKVTEYARLLLEAQE